MAVDEHKQHDDYLHICQQLEQERAERLRLEARLPVLNASPSGPSSVFEQFFEKSADANLLLADGMFVNCNQAAVTMFRCDTKAQLLSIHPSRVSPEYQPDGQGSMDKASAMMALAIASGNHRFEWIHRRVTGEEFWAEVSLVPLSVGGTQMLHATCRDISDRKQAEADLFKQQQLLRSTYEGVEHCIVIIDVQPDGDFRYVAWNPATEKMTGVPSHAVVGKTPEELFGDIHGSVIRANYHRCLEAQRAVTYEELLPFQGRDHWWLTTLAPLTDETGQVVRIVLTTFDITDRKQIEATLQQKEAQYRSIFEAINDGLLINDLTTGKLVAANLAAAEMHGYELEDFMQLNLAQIVHTNSLPKFNQYLDTICTGGKRYTCEAITLCNDGSTMEIEMTGVVCSYNGAPHGLVMMRDISERKAFEQQQARLIAILEATSDVVGMADMEGRQQYLNAAGYRMFQIPANESVVGAPIELCVADWAKPTLFEEGIPTALRDGSWQGEIAIISLKGREVPISQVIIAHRDADGIPVYLSTIMRDMSVQKQTEKILKEQARELKATLEELQRAQLQMIQSEKMSSLGQLVAGVAHEINNPVGFIYGNLNPLKQYTEDLLHILSLYQQHYSDPGPEIQTLIDEMDLGFVAKDLPRMMASMSMGTKRIREIVDSLRTFSRLDESACKSINIHEGLDSSLVILEHRLKATESRAAIQVVKQYSDLPLVECYAGQLNQVLMNILVNALDALDAWNRDRTPDAQPYPPSLITITTQMVESNYISICITNNGPEIPEAVQPRIFDPFFTTKPVGQGTGMGMSISYQIVTKNHGGTLQCVSSPTTGTSFIITIPLKLSSSRSHN